jgi:hypothetical protein
MYIMSAGLVCEICWLGNELSNQVGVNKPLKFKLQNNVSVLQM